MENCKKYLIKKGNHKASGLNFGLSISNRFRYKASFTKSCLYNFENDDKFDINKLCGVSTDLYHHNQSARIGWRSNGAGGIEILAYWYDDGVRYHEHLLHIDLEEEVGLEILCLDDKFYFTAKTLFDHVQHTVELNNKPCSVKYKLYPYFGGNQKAPNDISIFLKEI